MHTCAVSKYRSGPELNVAIIIYGDNINVTVFLFCLLIVHMVCNIIFSLDLFTCDIMQSIIIRRIITMHAGTCYMYFNISLLSSIGSLIPSNINIIYMYIHVYILYNIINIIYVQEFHRSSDHVSSLTVYSIT